MCNETTNWERMMAVCENFDPADDAGIVLEFAAMKGWQQGVAKELAAFESARDWIEDHYDAATVADQFNDLVTDWGKDQTTNWDRMKYYTGSTNWHRMMDVWPHADFDPAVDELIVLEFAKMKGWKESLAAYCYLASCSGDQVADMILENKMTAISGLAVDAQFDQDEEGAFTEWLAVELGFDAFDSAQDWIEHHYDAATVADQFKELIIGWGIEKDHALDGRKPSQRITI